MWKKSIYIYVWVTDIRYIYIYIFINITLCMQMASAVSGQHFIVYSVCSFLWTTTKFTTHLVFISKIPTIVFSIANQSRIHTASIPAHDCLTGTDYKNSDRKVFQMHFTSQCRYFGIKCRELALKDLLPHSQISQCYDFVDLFHGYKVEYQKFYINDYIAISIEPESILGLFTE